MNISNITGSDKRFFIIVASCLLLLSAFLHFWKIGEVPNGFYADESSIGYNAWCIAETGADEYEIKYPVFFKCFGNYHDPVMVYFLAPLMKIFGPEKWVVRFPSALFHLLASIAFFFLAAKYASNRWICLAGAFVFSTLPWIFPVSRVMMSGYTAMLLGIIAGWYFLMQAFGKRSVGFAVASGISWAFAMYAHNIGRPMTAAILVCFVLAMNVLLIRRWKVFLAFLAAFAGALVPMIASVINNYESMTSRFSTLKVWAGSSGIPETASRMVDRYLEYFSPAFLFINGDSNLRHNSGASGELYVFMAPFIIAGFYCFYKGFRRNPFLRFALLGILVYPLAAVLTIDHMHSMRALNGVVFWNVLAVIGAGCLWRKRNVIFYRIVLYAMPVVFIFELTAYMSDYFGKYPERSRLAFAAPLIEAFEYSFKKLEPGETLYVSASSIPQKINVEFKPFWYMYLLFFGKVPPSIYQAKGLPMDYICAYQGQPLKKGILVRNNIVSFKDGNGVVHSLLNDEKVPVNGVLIQKFPIMPGEKVFIEVYRIK
ncbi:MAG: hypothetical protein A2X45_18295 [Lentisphaerae bacterium GWF2_50_93]|nr:MAG: hypothetical protein A2X45_18295 [Lentisphaerae bacterium GWF2_50_93]